MKVSEVMRNLRSVAGNQNLRRKILSDAGFLVVVVAGAVVAVDAGAAGVDGVAAVILGAGEDIETILLNLSWER